jgi:glycosyltransferase involved in cell wall biosynthesis
VVIPVYNGSAYLEACLGALCRSTCTNFECIVVDDGSTDDSAKIASRCGARVVSTKGRCGPAHARNLGARSASGSILFFIDADVSVYPSTVDRILAGFQQDPELDAVIGSYDDSPGSGDFLSQYRNLMHCYVHQTGKKQACTFWSGCGAIRRDVFLAHQGFNEDYGRPAIEDIELGYRLAASGKKVMLDRRLLVKHLKRWNLWSVVRTDIMDRGIPWTELILRDHKIPNDLNVQLSQRLSVALVFLMLGIAGLTSIRWGGYFLAPLFALVLFLLARYWVDAASPRQSKTGMIALTATIAGIVWMAYAEHMPGLVYPVVLGYLLLFLRHRYAYATYSRRRLTGALLGLYMVLTIVFILHYLPNHFLVFGFFATLAILVGLNLKFYLFLAAKRGRLFAATAIPFHLLYFFYNGISFLVGLARHASRGRCRRRAENDSQRSLRWIPARSSVLPRAWLRDPQGGHNRCRAAKAVLLRKSL